MPHALPCPSEDRGEVGQDSSNYKKERDRPVEEDQKTSSGNKKGLTKRVL